MNEGKDKVNEKEENKRKIIFLDVYFAAPVIMVPFIHEGDA